VSMIKFIYEAPVRGLWALTEKMIRQRESWLTNRGVAISPMALEGKTMDQLRSYQRALKKQVLEMSDRLTLPGATSTSTPTPRIETPKVPAASVPVAKPAPVVAAPVAPTPKAHTPAPVAVAPAVVSLRDPSLAHLSGRELCSAVFNRQLEANQAKQMPKASADPRPVMSSQVCIIDLATQIYGENTVRQLHDTVGQHDLENRCARLFYLDNLGSYIPGFQASVFSSFGPPKEPWGASRIAHSYKVRRLQNALAAQNVR
jgi:hypothetical protein